MQCIPYKLGYLVTASAEDVFNILDLPLNLGTQIVESKKSHIVNLIWLNNWLTIVIALLFDCYNYRFFQNKLDNTIFT